MPFDITKFIHKYPEEIFCTIAVGLIALAIAFAYFFGLDTTQLHLETGGLARIK